MQDIPSLCLTLTFTIAVAVWGNVDLLYYTISELIFNQIHPYLPGRYDLVITTSCFNRISGQTYTNFLKKISRSRYFLGEFSSSEFMFYKDKFLRLTKNNFYDKFELIRYYFADLNVMQAAIRCGNTDLIMLLDEIDPSLKYKYFYPAKTVLGYAIVKTCKPIWIHVFDTVSGHIVAKHVKRLDTPVNYCDLILEFLLTRINLTTFVSVDDNFAHNVLHLNLNAFLACIQYGCSKSALQLMNNADPIAKYSCSDQATETA